jgi:hypothetical protein
MFKWWRSWENKKRPITFPFYGARGDTVYLNDLEHTLKKSIKCLNEKELRKYIRALGL